MSLRLHAGPADATTTCDHGGPTLPSDPDDIDLIQPCEADGAVHTPWPAKNVVGTVVLCEWHFARLLADHPDLEAKLREIFREDGHDLDASLPEHALLTLDDAPDEIERLDRTWVRLGLDQRGCAHYRSQAGGTVLVLDGELNVEQVQALDRRTLADWLEVTRLVRGWAEIDDRVEYYSGGDDGR